MFPSVLQDIDNTKRIAAPENSISYAEAAELRLRNQELEFRNDKLEEECKRWREKYEESERKCNGLEKKRVEGVVGRTTAGVDL